MSTLKELLKNVPVEWKAVSEVCTVFNGYAFDSTKFNNNEIGLPLIRIRDINTGFSNTYYSGDYDERFVVRNGDILIGMDGDFKVTKWSNGKALLNQRVCRLQNFQNYINPNFIFYIIDDVLIKIHNSINSTTVKHLSSKDLNNSTVPIPFPNDPQKSLAIQQEIVRVLDSLSDQNKALTSALAQEIDQRKKQYAYYREELFRFEGKEVEWKTLGEVSYKISSGKNKSKSSNGKYPLFGSTGIIGKTDTLSFTSDKLLVARVGANAGFVYIASGEYDVSDNALVIENKEHIAMFYLYYYLTDLNLNRFAKGAGQPLVTGTFLKEIKIPVPSIQEQERIVRLLDQFDEATKNIVAQLEKEIELRNKQYEYYRNQLLMFNC